MCSSFIHYSCFYYHSQCLRTKIKFVWGCGGSRQSKSISFLKIKPLFYYFKGLTGAHLDITIVLTITVNVWEQNKVCVGGVVLADSMKVFSFLKIKLPPPLSISMTKYLLIHSAKQRPFIHCLCFLLS